jgi:hypothetical protein
MAEQINIELKGFDKIQEQLSQTEASISKLKSGLDLKQGADSIKGLGAAAAETTNKTGGLSGAFKGLKDGLGSIPGPIGAATTGFQGLSKAGLAFVANPVGAVITGLVVVFGIFKKALESTEKGTFALNKIMAGFGAILKPIMKAVGEFAALLAEGLAAAMEAVAVIAETMGIEMGTSVKEGMALAQTLNEIEEAEGDLAVARAQQNKALAEAREILSDTNATYAQRKAALDEVRASEEKLAQQELDLANKKLAAAQADLKQAGASKERLDAEEAGLIAVANAEADLAAKKRLFNKEEKKLIKEVEDAEKEAAKEREARAKEREANAKAVRDLSKKQRIELLQEELKSEFERQAFQNQLDKQTRLEEIKALKTSAAEKNRLRTEAEVLYGKREAEIVAEYRSKLRAEEKKLDDIRNKERAKEATEKFDKDLKDAIAARSEIAKDTIKDEKKLALELAKIKTEETEKALENAKVGFEQLSLELGEVQIEVIKGIGETEEAYQKRRIEALKESLDSGKTMTIENAVLTQEEIDQIEKDNEAAKKELKREQDKADAEERIANEQAIADASIELAATTFNAIRELRQISLNNQLSDLEVAKGKELSVDGLTEQAKYEIELKYYEQSEALKEEAFKSDKRLQYALALIDLGKMITSTLAQYPKFDGGIAMTAAIITQTAVIVAQLAKIAATKYQPGPKPQAPTAGGAGGSKFEQGGLLSGPSHSMGGIKTAFAEMEGNEFVVNRRATSAFLPILESINNTGRYTSNGVPGPGGIAPIFKTYVVASDVSTQQEMDRKIMDSARL